MHTGIISCIGIDLVVFLTGIKMFDSHGLPEVLGISRTVFNLNHCFY